jgi:hypothetical protein
VVEETEVSTVVQVWISRMLFNQQTLPEAFNLIEVTEGVGWLFNNERGLGLLSSTRNTP